MEEVESQENKRRHEGKRIQKETVVTETLANLENGSYETYRFSGGQSDVWEDFVKIRKHGTQEHVGFVQCIECKGLLSFKEDSGTSHLLRHKCPKDKSNESGITTKFRSLPLDKVVQTRRLIANDILKYCTNDMVSCEAICNSKNFLNFSQSFVSHGYKNGCFDVGNVFPSCNYVNRVVANIKDEKSQEICSIFRESIKRQWCSATLEIQNFESNNQSYKTVVMGIQYFEKDLTGLSKRFSFSFILCDDDTSDSALAKLIKNFNLIGGDESDLQTLKIVTPNETFFSTLLPPPIGRKNCVVNAITKILNKAFETTNLTEKFDTLSNCRGIVKHINHSEKYNLKLEEDVGSWKSRMCMIQSIIDNYDGILKIYEDEDKDLQFNKRKADEILQFLEPFVEAIDDLSSTNHTTANKILLWHGVLSEHLKNHDNFNVELKRIITTARDNIGSKFCPTLDNKIDCFLDPRFKYLKMLTEVERRDVLTEVRRLLDTLEVDRESVEAGPSSVPPPSKKSRFANFEVGQSDKHKGKQKKASRFARFEMNNEELEEMDEVDMYIKLPAVTSSSFSGDFEIISKFWKPQKNKLPKLFHLVTTRLHVPASCGDVGIKSFHLIQHLEPHTLTDYQFVRNNL